MDANFYGGCNDMSSLLENSTNNAPCWHPFSSSFNGTMMNFELQQPKLEGLLVGKRQRCDGLGAPTSDGDDTVAGESEKKRRLTSDQVKFLEKVFEVDNRLEPYRKAELAKQLGVNPKLIATWFQNKRAHSKSKQIEKEYDTLKENYERLKVDYDSLNVDKQKLQNEVEALKKKLVEKERNKINSSSNILLHFEDEIPIIEAHGNVDEVGSGEGVVMSSTMPAKCLHFKDGNQPTLVQVEASTNLIMSHQVHQADFSEDDEEHMMMNNILLMPQSPPTLFDNFI